MSGVETILARNRDSVFGTVLRLARYYKLHHVTNAILSEAATVISDPVLSPPRIDVLGPATLANEGNHTTTYEQQRIRLYLNDGKWKRSRWNLHDVFESSYPLDGLSIPLLGGDDIIKMPEDVVMYVLTNRRIATSVPIYSKSKSCADVWMQTYLSTRDGSGTLVHIRQHEWSSDVSLKPATKIAWYPGTTVNEKIALPLEGFVASANSAWLTLSIISQSEVILTQQYDKSRPYKCLGHDDIYTDVQCKLAGGIWDRPCMNDSECPFYLINSNDNRGGCTGGGYCEVPVGITSVGYRKFILNQKSYPLCEKCGLNTDDPTCACDKLTFGN